MVLLCRICRLVRRVILTVHKTVNIPSNDSTAAYPNSNSAIADATTGPNGNSPLYTTSRNGSSLAQNWENIATNATDILVQDY